jgi:four helix bundle protein
MRDFRKLKVWQKAHEVTLGVYRMTEAFPDNERYGLVSQMRRSAASIASNLAESCGREGELDRARFVTVAGGSACELEYQLILARDLALCDDAVGNRFLEQVREVKRMLTAFRRALQTDTLRADV